MRKELEQKLFESYPELFKGRHEGLNKNLMGFGFECGDGWFNLINALSKHITQHVELRREIDPSFDVIVFQVKEKYGGLRFYCNGDDEVFAMIGLAEHLSEVTCEECGKPGESAQAGYWLKTLCEDCIKGEFKDYEFTRNLKEKEI